VNIPSIHLIVGTSQIWIGVEIVKRIAIIRFRGLSTALEEFRVSQLPKTLN